MARQSPDRRNAEDPDAAPIEDELGDLDVLDNDDLEDDTGLADAGLEDAGLANAAVARDAATESLWAELRVEPIEIALVAGAGYTLRAYRSAAELTPTEVNRDEEEDPFATPRRRSDRDDADEDDEDTAVLDDFVEDADSGDEDDDALDDDASDDDEAEEEESADEEVPVFLGHRGRLYLFRTPESLVEFVRSGAENDLAQLDTWPDLVDRIRPEDVAATGEDSYELDLVVDNLRGGHDAWDAELIIGAGEVARDVAYAFRVEPILTALAPGSPLDDLDEALRGTVPGGLGGFFARRRLRKIGTQQATLGWRTIIGKISSVVDWRD